MADLTKKEAGLRMELDEKKEELKMVDSRINDLRKMEDKEGLVAQVVERLTGDYPEMKVLKNRFELLTEMDYGEGRKRLVDNFFIEADEYLFTLMGKVDPPVMFLLAHAVGRVPYHFMNSLYEGFGYDKNRKQKEWEVRLGLSDFFTDGTYSDGDRYHGLASDIFSTAIKMVAPDLFKEYQKVPGEIALLGKGQEKLQSVIFAFRKNLQSYNTIRQYGYDSAVIEEKMSWLIGEIAKTVWLKDLKIFTEDRVAVLLSQKSYTGRGRGVEYGSQLTVFRDSQRNVVEKYYKFRDPHSESGDNSSNRFSACSVTTIDDSSIVVQLDNDYGGKTEKVFLSCLNHNERAKVEADGLNKNQQQVWLAVFEAEKTRLLERSFLSEARMPAYIRDKFSGVQMEGIANSSPIPYDRPCIVDEHTDVFRGVGAFVVKSQIDHNLAQGRQYSWRTYIVDLQGKSDCVDYQNAYEADTRDGKRIEINAKTACYS